MRCELAPTNELVEYKTNIHFQSNRYSGLLD